MRHRYTLVVKDRTGVVHEEPYATHQEAWLACEEIMFDWQDRGLEVWQVASGFQAVDEDGDFLASVTVRHGPEW